MTNNVRLSLNGRGWDCLNPILNSPEGVRLVSDATQRIFQQAQSRAQGTRMEGAVRMNVAPPSRGVGIHMGFVSLPSLYAEMHENILGGSLNGGA